MSQAMGANTQPAIAFQGERRAAHLGEQPIMPLSSATSAIATMRMARMLR